jgi:CRP-like cAMP-binding protein
MTLRDRERPQGQPRAQPLAAVQRAPGAFLSRLTALGTETPLQATPLKLRQRQRIPLSPSQDDLIFALQSGVVTARISMANGSAGLITLYFPGDVITVGSIPCFNERALVAATAGDILRFKAKPFNRLLASDPDLLAAYDRQRDRQLARAALHATILATLDGPQRLAAFLIERSLEIGIPAGTAIAIELPLSRMEIAQHLALNADTLSRLVSRFKADGLLIQKSRHQVSLKNWRAIAEMCPVTPALIALERNRPSPPA